MKKYINPLITHVIVIKLSLSFLFFLIFFIYSKNKTKKPVKTWKSILFASIIFNTLQIYQYILQVNFENDQFKVQVLSRPRIKPAKPIPICQSISETYLILNSKSWSHKKNRKVSYNHKKIILFRY